MKNSLLPMTALALAACVATPRPGSVAAVRHVARDDADLVDEIIVLKSRDGVTQPYLLATRGDAQPKVIALMFPGGSGLVGLPADVNQLRTGSNFLVRTRDLFRDRDLAVAILDAPSDRRAGMDDGFRTGQEHVLDVTAVVEDLRRRFPAAKVFLVGTSRGTLSAAYVGRSLGHKVDGVVLTSTVFSGSHRAMGLGGFAFDDIPVPLLFVHHAADQCRFCPYGAAAVLATAYPLITVKGGRHAQSSECEPLSAHGYFGKEAGTVAAIKNWMLGFPYPSLVE